MPEQLCGGNTSLIIRRHNILEQTNAEHLRRSGHNWKQHRLCVVSEQVLKITGFTKEIFIQMLDCSSVSVLMLLPRCPVNAHP